MWSRYDGTVVREELALLAANGCNVTRSFCYWPDFVPRPEHLDEGVVARFADFLEAHAAVGMGTIPTFIVGHMSGQNWDPPWREGRDLYRDVWMVSQQAWFAAEIAKRFGGHRAVVGWLVTNEMPLYAGSGTVEEVTSWARIVVQAVRSAGATQPISLGDGAWGREVTGRDNGYSLRRLAPIVDFVGPHVYPMESDQVRQFLTAAFVCELAGCAGLPVVLEEFGLSSDFSSDEHGAHYYRHVLHSTLLAGVRGWVAWNNCDYDDLSDEDPYRHHPFEMHFGLVDRDGRPKPQLHEMARFAALVGRLARRGWSRSPAGAAIVVPEHLQREVPFVAADDRADIRDNLLQGYVAAREADIPVELLPEEELGAARAQLYLLPSIKLLSAPGWHHLTSAAAAGATVYASYFPGSVPNQRAAWGPCLNELFGVRHRLRYGLVDPIEDGQVRFEFVTDFGHLVPGTTLVFRVAGSADARAYLPVDPVDAEVVALDQHGRPALLRRRVGDGNAVLSTYPIEHLAARSAAVNPEDSWQLYSALAVLAGARRPVVVHDPRVLCGSVVSGPSLEVVLANVSAETVVAKPEAEPGAVLRADDGSEVGTVALEPFEITVLQLHDGRAKENALRR